MEKENQSLEQQAPNIEDLVPTAEALSPRNSNSALNSINDIIERDIEAFNQSYPNISREALKNDQCFLDFIEVKEHSSLSELYAKYEKMVAKIEENAIRREQTRQANAKSAVGALKGETNSNEGFFTKEQVLKMSPQEIKQNYIKIRESQANW